MTPGAAGVCAVLLVGGDVARRRKAGVEAQMGDRGEGCRFDFSGEVEAADTPTFVSSVADPSDRAGRRYVALVFFV
jgi:hypothetical protein